MSHIHPIDYAVGSKEAQTKSIDITTLCLQWPASNWSTQMVSIKFQLWFLEFSGCKGLQEFNETIGKLPQNYQQYLLTSLCEYNLHNFITKTRNGTRHIKC